MKEFDYADLDRLTEGTHFKLPNIIIQVEKNNLHRTTANVRFDWITSLTQIMLRITSYIRKRCRK